MKVVNSDEKASLVPGAFCAPGESVEGKRRQGRDGMECRRAGGKRADARDHRRRTSC